MKIKNEKPLRFAALIRVSTERQEKTGESLRTQRSEIERAVADAGGAVVEWYGGQEHATPGWEKKEVSRLLTDAAKQHRKFDALMVNNADRWSRDNAQSDRGLDLFKQHGIRFFVLSTEHELFNPEARMFLGMSAVIGHYQATIQNKKSMLSRIHRAKRGIPTGGRLPFGRTFNSETGKWAIDPEKQQMMQDVARRYIAGESVEKLSARYSCSQAGLFRNLTKRCGSQWEQRFDSDALNIHESVMMTIPELLPEDTIQKVLARTSANETYTHGALKHQYLLARMVFCESCGYAMFGQTSHRGGERGRKKGGEGEYRYYRHAHAKRKITCKAHTGWVPAYALEQAVIFQLFDCFGNPSAIERAVESAMPDLDAQRQVQDQIKLLDEQIAKQKAGRQRVVGLVQRGSISDEEAAQTLDAAQNRIQQLEQDREQLISKIANVPTAEEIRVMAGAVAGKIKGKRKRMQVTPEFVRANAVKDLANMDIHRMTYEEKRDLVQRIFAGKTPDGKRGGVYISWPKQKGGSITYTIRGLIELPPNGLPSDGGDSAPDPDDFDLRRERQADLLGKTKSTLHGQHASRTGKD